MFCYGFISHRSQVFPYQIIKFFKQTISPYYHPRQTYFDKIKKIKNEYKNWNVNPNWDEVVVKKYIPKFLEKSALINAETGGLTQR